MVHNGRMADYEFSANARLFAVVNTFFSGALIFSPHTKLPPLDTWGNVKIPKIERYERMSQPDQDVWYTTSQHDVDLAVYISLVGIPIDGNQADTSTTDYSIPVAIHRCAV
jgi:hypothetical protein